MADIEWPLTAQAENQEFWLEWATSRTTSTFTRQQQVMGRPGAERWRTKITIGRRKQASAIAFDAFMSSMKGGIQTVLMPDFRRLYPASAEYGSYQDWIDDQFPEPVPIYFDTGAYWDIGEEVGALLAEDGRELVAESGDGMMAESVQDTIGSILTESGDRLAAESDLLILAEVAEAPFLSDRWDADVPTPYLAGGTGSTVSIAGVKPAATVFLAGDLIQTSPGRAHEIAEDATSDAEGYVLVTVRPRLRTAAVPGVMAFPARARMRIDNAAAARNPTRPPVVSSYEVELTEDLTV